MHITSKDGPQISQSSTFPILSPGSYYKKKIIKLKIELRIRFECVFDTDNIE